jgi:hypothetical protein
MNHLKNHAQTIPIYTFLTYADNYAIGYFQKQVSCVVCLNNAKRDLQRQSTWKERNGWALSRIMMVERSWSAIFIRELTF